MNSAGINGQLLIVVAVCTRVIDENHPVLKPPGYGTTPRKPG